MPRLKHSATGVVVDVDEKTAEHLPAEFKPVTEKPESRRKPPATKKG